MKRALRVAYHSPPRETGRRPLNDHRLRKNAQLHSRAPLSVVQHDGEAPYFGRVACQSCTTLKGGGWLTGTANRKRAPSFVTPHSGITPGSLNSSFAVRGRNSPFASSSRLITEPSGVRYNNSRPSRPHRGEKPPPSEMRMLSPA